MIRVTGGLAVLLALTAVPAAAQEAKKVEAAPKSVEAAVKESGVVPAVEAAVANAEPELERAVGQLAAALGTLVKNTAGDPELRASAARAGRGIAQVAELAVVEQSNALTEALRALADRLDTIVSERERRK